MNNLPGNFLFAVIAAAALAFATSPASATQVASRDIVALDAGDTGLERAHHRRGWRGYRYGYRPYYWGRHYYRPYYWHRPYYWRRPYYPYYW